MSPEVIKFECLREAVERGQVYLPEQAPSACLIPIDPSNPQQNTNVRDLPAVECLACDFGKRSRIAVESVENLQIVGTNPVYYEIRLTNCCTKDVDNG